MFKSAATKIAHNTTIPALAGNPELRSLQELITAEKAVIVSYVSPLCLTHTLGTHTTAQSTET